MKKILLATLALAVMFASCSKEDNGAQSEDSVLIVKLPDNVSLRSVEAQATPSGIDLDNVTVFLLNGNTVAATPVTFSNAEITAKYKRIEQVSSGVNNVIVVANIPSGATVASLTTGTAIKEYAYTIASQNVDIKKVTRMGTGIPATAPDPAPDTHEYKAVTVELTPLTARFEIGTVKAGTGVANVELVGVWINDYYPDGAKGTPIFHSDSNPVWVASPSTLTSPSSTAFGAITVPAYTEPSYYNAANNTAVTLTAGSQVYAYQVFAGAKIPHLILLVKGEYDTGYYLGTDKYFLRYLTYRQFLDGGTAITSVAANTIYKVGVGVTGITVNAEEMTEWPELNMFDLGITVTVTPWTEKNVTPAL